VSTAAAVKSKNDIYFLQLFVRLWTTASWLIGSAESFSPLTSKPVKQAHIAGRYCSISVEIKGEAEAPPFGDVSQLPPMVQHQRHLRDCLRLFREGYGRAFVLR